MSTRLFIQTQIVLLLCAVITPFVFATPEGLQPDEWQSIQQQIRAAEYHPVPAGSDGDYAAANRARQLHTRFGKDGRVQVTPPTENNGLSLRLTACGYGEDLQPVPAIQNTVAKKNRLEYHRGDITEWYVNDQRGVEQGFTLEKPPTRRPRLGSEVAGANRDARAEARTPLMFALTLDTALSPELSADAQSVRFKNAAGDTVFHYNKLHVFDAAGQTLPAHFELAGTAGEVRIVVADGGAMYPLTVDPMITSEIGKINRIYRDDYDYFGDSVAVDGDTLLVGASGDEHCYMIIPNCEETGVVYVFILVNTDWYLQARLTAIDAAANDKFGSSVALSGDTALIGVERSEAGAAYVFIRNGIKWSQQAKLTAADAMEYDSFGHSVALSGNTALIGSVGDSNYSGAAYVFTRTGTDWSQQAKLIAADAEAYAQFGNSVALNGDTALIGAYRNDAGGEDAGAAYVFTRTGTAWSQQAKLTAADPTEGNQFGASVALSGDIALIGAPAKYTSGSAYVFSRTGTGWLQQEKLTTVDYESYFGESVALSGDTALIGAGKTAYVFTSATLSMGVAGGATPTTIVWSQQATLSITKSNFSGGKVAISGDTALVGSLFSNDGGDEAGSAYVFSRDGTDWSQQTKLIAADTNGGFGNFGGSVSIDDNTILIGAEHDDTAGDLAGIAYIFVRDGTGWSQQAKLIATDISPFDYFGHSVALSGDTALIGAYRDDDFTGSAYVFTRTGTKWSQQAKLTVADRMRNDMFGVSVALNGNTALIGAMEDDDGCPPDDPATTEFGENEADCNTGSVYIFTRTHGDWAQQAKLTASDAVKNNLFGSSVALSGDTALIGAYDANSDDANAAYVFIRIGTEWSQQAKITAENNWFGSSVALNGDTALIGAVGNGLSTGAAYVFTRTGTTWTQQAKLTASDAVEGNRFGGSVALSGDSALIGTWGDGGSDTGAAYLFVRTGANWSQQAKITASDAGKNIKFGYSVTLDGNTALIGTSSAGSAYLFDISFINTAPVLSSVTGLHLETIEEDGEPLPTSVAELLDSLDASVLNDIPDLPFTARGIAITGTDDINSAGLWEYSVNEGAAWQPLNNPTPEAALLLSEDKLLRFRVTETDFNTQGDSKPALTFRGWDRSNDCSVQRLPPLDELPCLDSGDSADVRVNGGETPYSTTENTATVSVIATSDRLEWRNARVTNPEGQTATLPPNAGLVAVQDRIYTVKAGAHDPRDAPYANDIRYTFSPLLPWTNLESSGNSATVTLAPTTGTAPGSYEFRLNAGETDGYPRNLSLGRNFDVQVLPALAPAPIPVNLPFELDFTQGTAYSGVTFTLRDGPGTLTPDGQFTWTPDRSGDFTVQVRAATADHFAEQTVALRVVDAELSAAANAPAYQDINTVQIPVLSGTGNYRHAEFSHIEVALQNQATGRYAMTDAAGHFGAFAAEAPVWTRAVDNLSDHSFKLDPVDLSWTLSSDYTRDVVYEHEADYKILVRGTDVTGFSGPVTEKVFTYQGVQAATELFLEASTPSLLNNAGELSLDGKLNRIPAVAGLDLAGLAIRLRITAPDGSQVEISKSTHTDTGQYSFSLADGGIPPLDQEGPYVFQTQFVGAAHLAPAESEPATVLVGASAGYALLVQGKIPNLEGQAAHYKTAGRIYGHLLKRGFEAQNVVFLSDFTLKGYEKPANLAEVTTAFADLQSKVNGSPAPLYVIMVDHGDVQGNFRLGEENISPEDLDRMLDDFEAGLTAAARRKPRLVIIGACYSGQFVPVVSSPANSEDGGRLVISSAAGDEVSYKGPQEPDGVRSGELFLEEFFFKLADGLNFKQAFEQAVETVRYATRSGDANADGPYADQALQHPLLDDNGDGRGSNSLSDGGDGARAATYYLGAVLPLDTNYGGEPAAVTGVKSPLFLSAEQNRAQLTISVVSPWRINTAPIDIRAPALALQRVKDSTEQAEIEGLTRIPTMDCSQETQTCSADYAGFDLPGKYEVFHFVRDSVTGGISPLRRGVVYKNKADNEPPAEFTLTLPADGAAVAAILVFDWTDSVDRDGLSYTFLLAEDAGFENIVVRRDELADSMTFLDDTLLMPDGSRGLTDAKRYYWQVEAVDNYGAGTATPVFSLTVDNPNAPPGIASIKVSSALGSGPTPAPTLEIADTPAGVAGSGSLLAPVPRESDLAVIFRAEGYHDKPMTLDTSGGTVNLEVELVPAHYANYNPATKTLLVPAVRLSDDGPLYRVELALVRYDPPTMALQAESLGLAEIATDTPANFDPATLRVEMPLVSVPGAGGSQQTYRMTWQVDLTTQPMQLVIVP